MSEHYDALKAFVGHVKQTIMCVCACGVCVDIISSCRQRGGCACLHGVQNTSVINVAFVQYSPSV